MGRERENADFLYLLAGLTVTLLTFALLLTAFGIVLDGRISFVNFMSYIITSVVLGVIASVFHYFRLFIAFWLFIAGILVGFADMARVFLVNDFGWNDLAGLMSFFSYIVIGFLAGLLIQVIHYLYKKFQARRTRPPEIK